MGFALKKERLHEARNEPQTRADESPGWMASARQNAGWLVALGVLEVVLGTMAIGAPLIAGIAASLFIGALLVMAGVARVIRVAKAQTFGQGLLALLAGLLGIACGLLILAQPLLGLGSLTLLLGAYFFVEGISCLFLSFRVRPHGGWGWLMLDGVITTLLAFLIAAEWPLSGVWALGTLLGVDIIVTGVAAISIGWAARAVTHHA